MDMTILQFITIFSVILYTKSAVNAQCPCIHGICAGDTCDCYQHFTGPLCAQEYCGSGFCEVGQACIAGTQCCSNEECTQPINIALELRGDEGGLPTVAYVGIACIVLMVGAMVAAVIIAKLRCGIFQKNGEGSAPLERAPSEKPDGISMFKPAADVTSIDIVADITNTWTRTDSNAALEAEGVTVPYQSQSSDSAVERFAWEEPEDKMAKAEADLKEIKAAEPKKSASSQRTENAGTSGSKMKSPEQSTSKTPAESATEKLAKTAEKPKRKSTSDGTKTAGGKRKSTKK